MGFCFLTLFFSSIIFSTLSLEKWIKVPSLTLMSTKKKVEFQRGHTPFAALRSFPGQPTQIFLPFSRRADKKQHCLFLPFLFFPPSPPSILKSIHGGKFITSCSACKGTFGGTVRARTAAPPPHLRSPTPHTHPTGAPPVVRQVPGTDGV